MKTLVATVVFPDMTLDAAEVKNLTPDLCVVITSFGVLKDDQAQTKNFSCYFYEADESFHGNSIEDVVAQLKNFLTSDQVVKSTGEPTIIPMNVKVED